MSKSMNAYKCNKLAGMSRGVNAIRIPAASEPASDARTAYFAGIIDGEGYVTLGKNTGRVGKPIWNVPTIVISMTCKETILACASYFNCGSVSVCDRHKRINPKHLTQYIWTIRWNDARRVAALVRPYAITKRAALDRIITLPIQRTGTARKFDNGEVFAMRAERAAGASYSGIAKMYGIGTMTAWNIINRKTYKDVL